MRLNVPVLIDNSELDRKISLGIFKNEAIYSFLQFYIVMNTDTKFNINFLPWDKWTFRLVN